MSAMESFTIPRAGEMPLRFSGQRLAWSSGRERKAKDRAGLRSQENREAVRWHEIGVYKTKGGRYIVQINYRTTWQREEDREWAQVVNAPDQVAGVLKGYDPVQYVQGFPPGEQFRVRQERMLSDIRHEYEAQVGEVLARGGEFAEAIE